MSNEECRTVGFRNTQCVTSDQPANKVKTSSSGSSMKGWCLCKAGAWPDGGKLRSDHWSPIPEHTKGYVHKHKVLTMWLKLQCAFKLWSVNSDTLHCSLPQHMEGPAQENPQYSVCILHHPILCKTVHLSCMSSIHTPETSYNCTDANWNG